MTITFTRRSEKSSPEKSGRLRRIERESPHALILMHESARTRCTPNIPPMNDLWNDIRFLSEGPAIQVVVPRASVVPPRLLSPEDARGCPGYNCTPVKRNEGKRWSRGIGLTKSVVSRDRGELRRLSHGDLIPRDSRVRNYARKVVRRSSRIAARRGFISLVHRVLEARVVAFRLS